MFFRKIGSQLIFFFLLISIIATGIRVSYAAGPGNVSNDLRVWFKANAGTNTIVDGGAITSWNDQGVNATHASAAGGASPFYYSGTHANAINYNPSLVFDGTSDFMNHGDDMLPTGKNPRTIFYVGQYSTTPAAGTDVVYSYGQSTGGNHVYIDTTSTSVRFGASTAVMASTSTIPFSANIPHIGIGRFFNVMESSLDLNGYSSTNATTSTSINTLVGSSNAVIGAFGAGPASFFSGRLSEVIVYGHDVTLEEKMKVQSYLAVKYGITLAGARGQDEILSATNTIALNSAPIDNFSNGQSFVAPVTDDIESLVLYGGVTGGTVTVGLYFCNGDVGATACKNTPNNTTVVNLPNYVSSQMEYRIPLSTPFPVVAGNTYSFSFEKVGAGTLVFGTAVDNPYASGNFYSSNTASTTQDLYFKLYGASTTSTTTPNYIASDNTVIWDASLDTTYNNDIAGIGQDDDAGLDQVKSRSQNSDGVLIMSSASAQDDGDFLLAGNDNGLNLFTVAGAPTGYSLLTRKWFTQETGDIGTVTLGFNVANTNYDIPTTQQYYVIVDTDNDASFTDETPVQLFDNGTNGDETSGDLIFSLNNINLNNGNLFTLATPSTVISGTLYSDAGVTALGAGRTITLLQNGATTGITTETDASGNFELNIASTTVAANDLITLFVDNETEDGVLVFRALGNTAHTGMDIYQNYLIARSETGTAITNANFDVAHNGDTDITAIYTNGLTNALTTASSKNFYIWPQTTWTAAGNNTFGGSFYNYGTSSIGATSVQVTNNFYVDNTATFTHTGNLIMQGSGVSTFNQGDDPITSNIFINNTSASGTVVTTNPMNVANLTINVASGKLYLNGLALTMSGTFANNGIMRLRGNETITGLVQDINSGTWNYVGDFDGVSDTYTIIDFGATDYFNLTIGLTTPTNTDANDIFTATSSLSIGSGVIVDAGTLDPNGVGITAVSTFSQTGGTYLLGSGTQQYQNTTVSGASSQFVGSTGSLIIQGNWTHSNGSVTFPSATTTLGNNFTRTGGSFNPNGGTLAFVSGANHFFNYSTSTTFHNLYLADFTNDGSNGVYNFSTTSTTTITGLLMTRGIDANDLVKITSVTPGIQSRFEFSGTGGFSGTFLNVQDNIAIDNSTGITVPINPLNSIDGGNTTNWFADSVIVEFNVSYATSTTEATANNFPLLFVSGILSSTSTIDVDIFGGSATNGGVDYTMTDPTTIDIGPGSYDGSTSTAIVIPVPTLVQDAIVESGGETIILSLTNPGTNVTIDDANSNVFVVGSTTYTITDDDGGVIVEFSTSTASSTENTGSAANFPTLFVLGSISATTTVDVMLSGGTAASTTDYTFTTPLIIEIAPGVYDGTAATDITITPPNIVEDSLVETSETIIFTLTNASTTVTIGDANSDSATTSIHTYTITDDDIVSVEFTSQTPSSLESVASPSWSLTVGGGVLSSAATVEVARTGGTASVGTDFTFVSPVTITIPAGDYSVATSVPVTGLTVVQDIVAETGGETILFIVQNPSGIVIGDADADTTTENTATYTITDDDTPAVVVTESGGSTTITEGGATDTYTIGLATIPSAQVNITLATDGECTVSPSGPLVFVGTTTQTVTVTAIDDGDIEGAHSCVISHTATSTDLDYDTIGISNVTSSVTDNDTPGTVVVGAPVAVTEADPNTPAVTDSFTFALTTIPSSNVTVTVSLSNAYIVLSDNDESLQSTIVLTFTPLNYNTPQTTTVTPVDDALVNGTRTTAISFVLASADLNYNALAVTNVTANITDGNDEDGDSISNTIEDANPINAGDGNGDSVRDSEQQDVASLPNSISGDYATLVATGSCATITDVDFVAESSLTTQDSDYQYPLGLIDFNLDCPLAGDSASIKILYGDTYTTSSWVYKKYNSNTLTYADSAGAVFGTETIGGTPVTTVVFGITDGGVGDEDGVADLVIQDPSGPATINTTPTSGGGGGGGGRRRTVVPVTPIVQNPISNAQGLLDLIGGGEPNVPAEFSDYVCERYMRSYIVYGVPSPVGEVNKLIQFLNTTQGETLALDGTYDDADVAAVNRFQQKYADQILAPWGLAQPTGVVGRTTTAKINIMMCSVQKGCPYFNTYLQKGDTSLDAVKVQDFINIIFSPVSGYPTAGIQLSKTFDVSTQKGVKDFQTVYKDIVLKPWGLTSATGWWYKTSRHAANLLLGCNEGAVELDNGIIWGSGASTTVPSI